MTRTAIEWTDETWNPVTGCTKVSPGCDNCYAETIAERFRGQKAFPNGFDVQLRPEKLRLPLTWRRPRRVFVNSMSDLFHDQVPDEFIAEVFGVMAAADRHTFQILTKRHGRMRSLLNSDAFVRQVSEARLALGSDHPFQQSAWWPLANVWLGVSVEDQKRADLRIPALLESPAAVRFLSCEPLLGPVDLGEHLKIKPVQRPGETDFTGLDWVIVGGESGPRARRMHGQWAGLLRDQCRDEGVAFFFKQWGAHGEDGVRRPKHHNGRHLDGQLHDDMPEATA